MSSVQRFEDLIAWQKAYALTQEVYRATRQSAFAQDRALANQMQRAAVSVMSNIAEGYERGNPGDFYRFLCIAKGSCAELRSQMYIARSLSYIAEAEFKQLMALTVETGRVIGGLRVSVQKKRANGH